MYGMRSFIQANSAARGNGQCIFLITGIIPTASFIKSCLIITDEQICYDVCDKLAELGFINDRRYAESLARKYMEVKKFGYFRAVQEMRLKGLSKELDR